MNAFLKIVVVEILYTLAFSIHADPLDEMINPAPVESLKPAAQSVTSRIRSHAAPQKKPTANSEGSTAAGNRGLARSVPDLAVKSVAPKEIVLPGLLRIPGVSAQSLDPTRGQIVQLANGNSSSVYVSNSDINLIQLPFLSPLVTSSEDIEIKQSGSNIYFQFKAIAATKPVQIFVENQAVSNTVLSLQLIPKSIVSQVILVVDNSGAQNPLKRRNKSSDYVSQTQLTMEIVANNQSPQGFTQVLLTHIAPVILNGLVIVPLSRLSSVDQEIFIYEARNPSKNVATLSEKEFDGDSVLAVSIFPTPVLRQGERTRVFVIAKKQPFAAVRYE